MTEQRTDRPELDRMFDSLSHPDRRRILTLLSDHDPRGETELGPEEVAAEHDDPRLLERELRHLHLPQLEEREYIEWDGETRTIRRGPRFDEVVPLIRLMQNHRDELPDGWP